MESGPIRGGPLSQPTTDFGAVAFTLVAAAALTAAVVTAPQWSCVLVDHGSTRTGTRPIPVAPAAVPTAPPREALASAWAGQSEFPNIAVGDTAWVTVTFRNTGTATWRRATPSEVRLGVVGHYDAAIALHWPYPSRPAIQFEPVIRPGQVATFAFRVRGGRPGLFRLRLRPVVDGVAWLDDQGVYVDVRVR